MSQSVVLPQAMSKKDRLDLVIPELLREPTLIEIIRCLQNTGGEFIEDRQSAARRIKKQSSQYIICMTQWAQVQTIVNPVYSAKMISECIGSLRIFPNEIARMIASYGMYDDWLNNLAHISWRTDRVWMMPALYKDSTTYSKNQLFLFGSTCYRSIIVRGMTMSTHDIQQLASRGYVYQYSPHSPEREYNIQFSLQELIEAANIVKQTK
jgi:hypothetical protein